MALVSNIYSGSVGMSLNTKRAIRSQKSALNKSSINQLHRGATAPKAGKRRIVEWNCEIVTKRGLMVDGINIQTANFRRFYVRNGVQHFVRKIGYKTYQEI